MQLFWFLPFYLFLSQFLLDLDENFIKIKLRIRATQSPSWFIGPETAVIFGLSLFTN